MFAHARTLNRRVRQWMAMPLLAAAVLFTGTADAASPGRVVSPNGGLQCKVIVECKLPW